jgi:hypothetical protein
VNLLYGAGAILLSHPFEVARVIIQNDNRAGMCGNTYKTLTSLYSTEGLTSLYRGLVPRMIHTLPTIIGVQTLLSQEKILKAIGANGL